MVSSLAQGAVAGAKPVRCTVGGGTTDTALDAVAWQPPVAAKRSTVKPAEGQDGSFLVQVTVTLLPDDTVGHKGGTGSNHGSTG